MDEGRTYLCIDLKSFYASVECVERGLDPFTTNLVVADPDRTESTICLAITPAMKELGIPNRCRVYQIPEDVDYIMAKPQMRHYMEVSAQIYSVYLRYISPEDIHVYSIDECFIDATPYLGLYGMTGKQLAVTLMDAVFAETGICATAGIGTNLFLAKVALDITAKHVEDHIGYLDQETFCQTLWHHRPLTDFWNIGPGISRRLAKLGARDLYDVAHLEPQVLYQEFGINAELLIDHARGIEPCTMAEIHAFKPESASLTNGQLLPEDYSFDEGLMILREMTDALVLEMVEKHLVCKQVHLHVAHSGHWGDPVSAGSRQLGGHTDSFKRIFACLEGLYRDVVAPDKPIRRISISFGGVMDEDFASYDLFSDLEEVQQEKALTNALLDVKSKFGKNAVMRGTSYQDKATGRERNEQVGGHHG